MKPKKNLKADLSKRTLLFLQLGLIIVLFFAYLGIEWKTYQSRDIPREKITMGDPDEEVIPVTIPVNTPPPLLPPPPADVVDVIENDEDLEEDEFASTEIDPEEIMEVADVVEAPKDEPIEPVPFTLIEDVPVYPGCEGLKSNEERRNCMSEKITQFINRNFDRDLGNRLGLTGVNRVNIIFRIDTEGNVTGVQSRAPHPRLEEEAERVINALPKMQPGKQRGRAVPVSYGLPIIFSIQE